MSIALIVINVLISCSILYGIAKITDYKTLAMTGGVSAAITIFVIIGSFYTTFIDFEILNGEVISKARNHGKYEQPYDCMCSESCSGSGASRSCSTTCSTCYEDRYTVDWSANTTVGSITFDHKDSGSRSVYNSPDPVTYTKCNVGDPASAERTFVNYIKGSPDSVYNSGDLKGTTFTIPAYPRVYDFYKYNRVINQAGVSTEKVTELNTLLNNELKTLGREKQVNVIVILTNEFDPMYKFAVENEWIGGKKNDVIVFISLDEKGQVQWVDSMTFAGNYGNEFFQVKLRDLLGEIDSFIPTAINSAITKAITESYDRPEMKKFEYIKEESTISGWAVLSSLILSVIIGFVAIHLTKQHRY